MQDTLEFSPAHHAAQTVLAQETVDNGSPMGLALSESVDIMQALRTATDAIHKSVERKTPFFKKGFDRPQYVRWLGDMVGFYSSFERALTHSGLLAQKGWNYHSRINLLFEDLRQLGQPERAHATKTNRHVAAILPLHNHPIAAGALYVIEGSALGGQILASRVLKALEISLENGGSFFQPNGPEPRVQWQQFQTQVRGMAVSPQDRQDIVLGAVSTFYAFDAWLTQCGWS